MAIGKWRFDEWPPEIPDIPGRVDGDQNFHAGRPRKMPCVRLRIISFSEPSPDQEKHGGPEKRREKVFGGFRPVHESNPIYPIPGIE